MVNPFNPMIRPVRDFDPAFEIVHEPIDVKDYLHFRKITGLGDKDYDAAVESLTQSIFDIQLHHKGRCIGFCRLLGDGGLWYKMVDGVILPEYQSAGIGKFLVSSVTYAFHEMAAPGAFMHAVTHAPRFAEKCGMTRLPKPFGGAYAWQPAVSSTLSRPARIPEIIDSAFTITDHMPDPETYHTLRKQAELPAKDIATTSLSFSNTALAIQVLDGENTIGFARILGDNKIWSYMVDVVTHPDYDDEHLTRFMMTNLTNRFFDVATPGAYMLVFSDRLGLVEQCGLTLLPEREVCLFAEQPYPKATGDRI